MAGRAWRVVGNFHTIGELVVFVTAPNWQGGLRKGALSLKQHPKMKGKRVTVGAFTIQEIEAIPVSQQAEQLPIASVATNVPQPRGQEVKQAAEVTVEPDGQAPLEAPPLVEKVEKVDPES